MTESSPPPSLPEVQQEQPQDMAIIDTEFGNGSSTQGPTAKGCLWGVAGAAGCLLILLAIVAVPAAIATGSVFGVVSQFQNLLDSAINPAPPTAGVLTSQTIVNRVQPLGQLVSTSAQVAKADIQVNIQQGRFGACDHSSNHVASATIEAGIDLTAINPESVNYILETDTYVMKVPAPEITSCYIEFIDQYERTKGFPTCTVDWDDARQIAQYEALIEFSEDAIEGGILSTAERDAQSAITNFIVALTGSNVQIEFIPTDPSVPSRCQPSPPRDWAKNETTGQWVRVR